MAPLYELERMAGAFPGGRLPFPAEGPPGLRPAVEVAAVVHNDPEVDQDDIQEWWDWAAGFGGAEAARSAASAGGFVAGAVAVREAVGGRVWGGGASADR